MAGARPRSERLLGRQVQDWAVAKMCKALSATDNSVMRSLDACA